MKIPHLVSAVGTLAFSFSIQYFDISNIANDNRQVDLQCPKHNSSTTRGTRATVISRNLQSWVWTNQSAELTYSHRWCNKCTNMGLQQQDSGTYCLVEYVREYVCYLLVSIVQRRKGTSADRRNFLCLQTEVVTREDCGHDLHFLAPMNQCLYMFRDMGCDGCRWVERTHRQYTNP